MPKPERSEGDRIAVGSHGQGHFTFNFSINLIFSQREKIFLNVREANISRLHSKHFTRPQVEFHRGKAAISLKE